MRNTGRKGVDRIVDKQAVGTGGRRGKKNNPDVTPGLKEEVTTHLTKVSCQSFRAPTRTRTWNPLIKRVECSRHCELGQTAFAIAVESGADSGGDPIVPSIHLCEILAFTSEDDFNFSTTITKSTFPP